MERGQRKADKARQLRQTSLTSRTAVGLIRAGAMATEKQIAASRANAMNSTGLRKGAGDAITLDPHVQADVEAAGATDRK